MTELLSGEAREAALVNLIAAGWTVSEDGLKLCKSFRFGGFPQALGWMVSVGAEAQRMDHHPEWRNVYRTVDVELTTHSLGGISRLDVELAGVMERLAG